MTRLGRNLTAGDLISIHGARAVVLGVVPVRGGILHRRRYCIRTNHHRWSTIVCDADDAFTVLRSARRVA